MTMGSAQGGSPRILLVDDDEMILKLVEGLLADAGYDIIKAVDGEDALVKAEDGPDLILLDLKLPGISGLEICRMLQAKKSTQDIPIVIFTSDSSPESLDAALDAGVLDYIIKPPKRIELITRVGAALRLGTERRLRVAREHKLNDISGKLAKHLPPKLFEALFADGAEGEFELYRKKIAVLAVKVTGLTDMADNLDSKIVNRIMTEFREAVQQTTFKHGGTVDKFFADEVLIFFGDPVTRGEKQDALNCARIAVKLNKKLKTLNGKWFDAGIAKELELGMGINCGFCSIGILGSASQREHTIIGGHANMARQLASMAKGRQILASEWAHLNIKDNFKCRQITDAPVQGPGNTVVCYEIIDTESRTEKEQHCFQSEYEGLSMDIDFDTIDPDKLIDTLTSVLETFEVKGKTQPKGRLDSLWSRIAKLR